MNKAFYGIKNYALRRAETESGIVEGLPGNNSRFTVFKGIPYAAPPVGELRWQPPKPAIPWEGVRKCYDFGNDPISFWPPQFGDAGANESEDCLFLNVWTPAYSTEDKLPVMVWIYGGGMRGGTTNSPIYDGEGFCKRGVILVTLNYRTGPLGLMAHPELSEKSGYGGSGNYYFMDQMAAIKWVRKNISAFGGDPENITIFGHSSGAFGCTGICASPLSKGDFHRAIIQSGIISRDLDGAARTFIPLKDSEEAGMELMRRCHCESVEEMRALDISVLKDAFVNWKDSIACISGTVDGYVFLDSPVHSFYQGTNHDVSYLVGSAADEEDSLGFPFGSAPLLKKDLPEYAKKYGDWEEDFLKYTENLTDANLVESLYLQGTMRSTALGETQMKFNRVPPYLFCFERRLPGDNAGAPHGAELPYVFQTLQNDWRPYIGVDYALSDMMADYWANFARTGNPNGEALPEWKPYTADCKQLMLFGETPYMTERKLSVIQSYKLKYFLAHDECWSFI